MEANAVTLRPLAPATAPAAQTPPAPGAAMSHDRLRAAARDFEAFFLARALEPMFAGVATEAPFGGGMAEDLWRSLLVDEYGKAMARAGGIGLAETMVRSLIEVQATASLPTPMPDVRPASQSDPMQTKEMTRP